MSDNHHAADPSLSDDMLLSRLFELVANGQLDSNELAQLDATISQRLQQNYDGKQPVMKLVRAA
jgi:conjugal transfer/entry exclusion protein